MLIEFTLSSPIYAKCKSISVLLLLQITSIQFRKVIYLQTNCTWQILNFSFKLQLLNFEGSFISPLMAYESFPQVYNGLCVVTKLFIFDLCTTFDTGGVGGNLKKNDTKKTCVHLYYYKGT